MTAIEPQVEKTSQQAAHDSAQKQRRPRRQDKGSEILPHMEHFITLVRRLQRPTLLCQFLENIQGTALPTLRELPTDAKGSLPLDARNAVFTEVAQFDSPMQAQIERAAERIGLLSDTYGTLAVGELLDDADPMEAVLLKSPTDKFGRALHLYMHQEFSPQGQKEDNRFDHAETRQVMLAQFQSEKYSSHYFGPKDALPTFDETAETTLKLRLVQLFPQLESEDIVIEHYEHHDFDGTEKRLVFCTLTALFNGKYIHYRQVANGVVEDHDEPAVTSVRYSWHVDKGELAVFCDDMEVRPELAKLFRDVVLGGNGDMQSLPLREFDLTSFRTPAILNRIQNERVDGIESIEIKSLFLAKPEVRLTSVRGKREIRCVENPLIIRVHHLEDRNIYEVASQVHGITDLTGYIVKQVRLSVKIRSTAHRKSHTASVQITAPNGFNDCSKTKDDRELILSQMERLGWVRKY